MLLFIVPEKSGPAFLFGTTHLLAFWVRTHMMNVLWRWICGSRLYLNYRRQSESPSEETTRMYYIGFRGDTLTPHKDTRPKLDLAAANAADAPVEKLAEKSASSQTTIR